MINRFQKSIWVLSSTAPILIEFSISWWIHKKSIWTSLMSLIMALVLICSVFLIFKLMMKNLSCIEINAKKVTQNDEATEKVSLFAVASLASHRKKN